jgi:hypothetical protein
LAKIPLIAYAEDLPIARRYWRHVFRTRLSVPPAVVIADLRGVLVPLLESEDPPINTGFLAQRTGSALGRDATRVRGTLLDAARTW